MKTAIEKSFKTEVEANQYAQENSYNDAPVNVNYNYRDDEYIVTQDSPGIQEKRIGRYHHGRKTYDAEL